MLKNFLRQSFSRVLSDKAYRQSPSSLIRQEGWNLLCRLADINKGDIQSLEARVMHGNAIREYGQAEVIRCLDTGKDVSLEPVVEVGDKVVKQIFAQVLPRFIGTDIYIFEPREKEVSRNLTANTTNAAYARYEAGMVLKSDRLVDKIKKIRRKGIQEYYIVNFISNTRHGNQFVVGLSGKELSEIGENEGLKEKLRQFCERYGFEIVALRPCKRPEKECTGKAKKLAVVFIDSLDRRIFRQPNIMRNLPNLKKFYGESTLYEGLVSAGSWTYPVMHSVMYGISPVGSMSMYRKRRFREEKNMDVKSISDASSLWTLNDRLADELSTRVNEENGLFNRLHKHDIESYVVNQSSNLSWLYGLTSGCTLSVERVEDVGVAVKTLMTREDTSSSLLWIDIDDLHRRDMASTFRSGSSGLSFLDVPSRSSDKLFGGKSSCDAERYLDNLVRVDRVFGEVVEALGHDTDIVIVSDHGSQAVGDAGGKMKGTLSEERIYFPTLLVRSDSDVWPASDELLGTQDMHSLILRYFGVEIIEQSISDLGCRELYCYYGNEAKRDIAISGGSTKAENGEEAIEIVMTAKSSEGKLFYIRRLVQYKNFYDENKDVAAMYRKYATLVINEVAGFKKSLKRARVEE